MDLTPEGILYYEHSKKILEAYRQAETAVSHSKEEPKGTLKILCGPQIGNLYVIPYLKEFLNKYSKLRLHIEFTQTLPDLEKEQIDLVIGLKAGIPLHWIQRTLIYARWVFCASHEYLTQHGEPKKPSDLKPGFKENRIIELSLRMENPSYLILIYILMIHER